MPGEEPQRLGTLPGIEPDGTQRRRGKGKPRAPRRDFRAEVQELERRIATALRLLCKFDPKSADYSRIELAIEMLEGK